MIWSILGYLLFMFLMLVGLSFIKLGYDILVGNVGYVEAKDELYIDTKTNEWKTRKRKDVVFKRHYR